MAMVTTDGKSTARIPRWISAVQVLLILIMLSQVYLFFLDLEAVRASGITIDTVADLNLAYEFGARTLTMAIVSTVILLSQRVELFMAMFLMNVVREGLETIIDPLFPLANAPGSPALDFGLHVIIVSIELFALFRLHTIHKATQ